MKAGYRYASYAWTIFRAISGSWMMTLLWQAAKYTFRAVMRARTAVRSFGGKGR
ncbi:hypothetical protein [Thermocaproicibacter melissae]|uniref:hypothetical protein n=1 Tax=Thermocaproicibacter melissae TaxID=2966552 RepID=UPI003A0FD9CD